MPSSEQLVTLKQSINRLDRLPNAKQLWERISLAIKFYITYSHKKPKFDTPEQIQEIARLSSTSGKSEYSLAKEYGTHLARIISTWDVLHMAMSMALSPFELGSIGLKPLPLSEQAQHSTELYYLYNNAVTNLRSYESIQETLQFNFHYLHLLETLAAGEGIQSYLDNYVGEAQSYIKRADQTEIIFREGLSPAGRDKSDPHSSNFNHSFLRKVVLLRYLFSNLSSTAEVTEVRSKTLIEGLEKVMEIGRGNGIYLTILQETIAKLPYYESKMTGNADYQANVRRMSWQRYLNMYKQRNLFPFPLQYMIQQEALGVTQADSTSEIHARGVFSSEGKIRNEISGIGRYMECALLTPNFAECYGDDFRNAITRTHKIDIARMTEVAAGRPDRMLQEI